MTTELPDAARAWVAALAPAEVLEIGPIGGGITDTKWLVQLRGADPLVIRWADPGRWGATGREHVRREAAALQLLAGSGLPVARLVGHDPDGSITGGPANVMSWRPGRVRLDPLGTAALRSLARLLVDVHRQPVPLDRRPPMFTLRGPAVPEVPTWARRPARWRQALRLLAAGPPPVREPAPYGLLHRDFHLGNTLWQGDGVSGLVDWAEASWGPPDLDVAHLCADLAMLHSVEAAAGFRAAYRQQGGRLDPDPAGRYWAIADIVGFLPDPAHILPAVRLHRPELTPDGVRRGLEELLEETLRTATEPSSGV